MENPPWEVESPRRADECLSGQSSNTVNSGAAQAKPRLRDYQIDIIDQVKRLDHPLIPLPTGGGKTVIAAAFIHEAVTAGLNVIFVVHRRELVIQASMKLLAAGVDHAILMGAESSEYLGQRCVVASIQTLHARAFRTNRIDRPPADIVFYDEAHHCRARTYVEVRKAYPGAKIIGLSATPARGDGRGLGGDLFSDLVKVPTYAELIEKKYLVPPVVYAPVVPDLKGVRTLKTGDYSPNQLEKRMNTNQLIGGIVEHWFKLGENRPTIVFTAGVQHSLHLRDEFRIAGVAAEHIDAKTPLAERKRIIGEFRAGAVKILCNCMIFIEGFDEPSASCLVLARPTKLLTMYRQMVGRVLRPYPGKVDARILDHSGSVYRHGYPDDEIQWVLSPDERAVNESEAARAGSSHKRELTTCRKCTAVRLEGDGCHVCGWKPETRPRYLEVADGDLGHVRRDRSVHDLPQDELTFYRELKGIFIEKRCRNPSIRPGYPASAFKAKTGRWPPRDWEHAAPIEPSPKTRAWVRSQDIAYAKAMQAQ
jgi:superfamily II DNA or RNA helicase